MLKDAISYLVGLGENREIQTKVIDNETYTTESLHRVVPYVPRPARIEVSGLDSIVSLVKSELNKLKNYPIFIRVSGARSVSVFSSFDSDMKRDDLYIATCDVPGFTEGFRPYDQAIIELRSKFIPNDGVDYLLELLASVNKENGVTTTDNGVLQQVEARTGVSLKQMVSVKPRVSMIPYRTFLEVEQPESEFLLRLDGNGNVGLFEADGGMWQIAAKRNICAYFEAKLKAFIDEGAVVVTM